MSHRKRPARRGSATRGPVPGAPRWRGRGRQTGTRVGSDVDRSDVDRSDGDCTVGAPPSPRLCHRTSALAVSARTSAARGAGARRGVEGGGAGTVGSESASAARGRLFRYARCGAAFQTREVRAGAGKTVAMVPGDGRGRRCWDDARAARCAQSNRLLEGATAPQAGWGCGAVHPRERSGGHEPEARIPHAFTDTGARNPQITAACGGVRREPG